MKKPQPRKQRRITSAKIDPAKPASVIINQRFNGLSHFCSLTGYATSTAHSWMISGHIQAHRKGKSIHAHILTVAAANNIKMKPSDFVELPAPPATATATLTANG